VSANCHPVPKATQILLATGKKKVSESSFSANRPVILDLNICSDQRRERCHPAAISLS
jgi:hypothetical protein